jgi:hypothetical protein
MFGSILNRQLSIRQYPHCLLYIQYGFSVGSTAISISTNLKTQRGLKQRLILLQCYF